MRRAMASLTIAPRAGSPRTTRVGRARRRSWSSWAAASIQRFSPQTAGATSSVLSTV